MGVLKGEKLDMEFYATGTTPIRYFLENYGAPFKIPDLGPIGITSGLAHPRHFRAPTASTVEKRGASELISKFSGRMYAKDGMKLLEKSSLCGV